MEIIEQCNRQETLMRDSVVKIKARRLMLRKVVSLSLFNLVAGGSIVGSVALLSKFSGLQIEWSLSIQGVVGVVLGVISLACVSVVMGMLTGCMLYVGYLYFWLFYG